MPKRLPNLSIYQLEALYKDSPSDETLDDLDEELRHRNTEMAVALHRKVLRTIKDRKRRASQSPQTAPQSPQYFQPPLFEPVPNPIDVETIERIVEKKVQLVFQEKISEIVRLVETLEKAGAIGRVSPLAKVILEKLKE